MVKYKNFGRSPSGSSISSSDNQTTGSFFFTTAAQQQQQQYRRDPSSEHSTKTISTGTSKSKNSVGCGVSRKQQQHQQQNQQQEMMIDSRCDDDETQHDDDDDQESATLSTTSGLRVLSSESNCYREGEAESLYDMTSYSRVGGNTGGDEDHSTSVCGASSYGYGDSVGDCTDSSAGTALSSTNGGGTGIGGGPGGGSGGVGGDSTLSPNTTGSTRGLSPDTSRSEKLSYMGYVPVSPTTAALMMQTDEGMAMMKNIRNNHNINDDGPFKKKISISNNNAADKNNNSGHTTGAATYATGATGTSFPLIKIDDTSTSRREQRVFAEERVAVGEQIPRESQSQREQQPPLCTSTASIGDTCDGDGDGDGDDFSYVDGGGAAANSSSNRSANIAEYISPGQQRLLEEEETERVQCQPALLLSLREQRTAMAEIGRQLNHHHHEDNDGDDDDDDEEEEETVGELVDDNGCEGTTTSSHNGGGGGTMASRTTTTTSVTSSVMPNPCDSAIMGRYHHQPATTRMVTNKNNIASSPTIQRVAKVTTTVEPSSSHAQQQQQQQQQQYQQSRISDGMVSPTLNHISPPSMMTMVQQQQHQHQQQTAQYQREQQYLIQQQQQQHQQQQQQQQQQQYGYNGNQYQHQPSKQQNFRSSHLQHLYPPPHHHQQQQQQQQQQHHGVGGGQHHLSSQAQNNHSMSSHHSVSGSSFVPRNPVLAEQLHAFRQCHHQQQDETNSDISGNQPFLICGPDGPKLRNVKFVTPGSVCGGATTSSGNNSTTRRTTNGTYGTNNSGISVATGDITATRYGGDGGICVQHPAGVKCETLLTNFLSTCNAIVSHGYQDTTTDEHGNKKASSTKQKRSQFEKIADKSIAGLAPPSQHKLDDSFAANAKRIFHNAGSNMMKTLPTDFQSLTQSAAYHNVFDTFQKYYEPEEALYEDKEENNCGTVRGGRAGVNSARNEPMPDSSTVISDDSDGIVCRGLLSDDPDEVGEAKKDPHHLDTIPLSPMNNTTAGPQVFDGAQSKPMVGKTEEEPRSPNPKIEIFKKLRQRRRRNRNESQSPIRRTSSAPTSPTSMSSVDKEKILELSYDTSQFKQQYIRNIHTKIQNIQGKEEKQQDRAESPIVETVESRDDDSFRDANEDSTEIPSNVSMQNSTYSWATPEEEASLKDSADGDDAFLSVQLVESNAPVLEVAGEGEEGKMTEEVVLSTSSGMSESLVGSDMDDEEPLDCNINSSISEEEQEVLSEVDDKDVSEDDMENMLLDSFEHDEFPHTPLDVIMEGSTEETEDDTRTIDTSSSSASVDGRKDDINAFSDLDQVSEENEMDLILEETESDPRSLDDIESFPEEYISNGNRHSFLSVKGLLKVLFTLALILQCGIVVDVDLWDHVADHVKSIDGGPYVIATLEDITINIKSSGLSLIPTANDIANLKLTAEDIVSNLKSSGGLFIATTKDLIKSTSASFLKNVANDLVELDQEEVSQLDQRRSVYHGMSSTDGPQEETTTARSSNNEELRLFQQLVDEALGSIHSDTNSEMVVDIVVPPIMTPDDATSKSEWIQELELTFGKNEEVIESI